MTNEQSTDSITTPAETFEALRRGRTSHPASSVRVSGGYEGLSVRLSAGGAVLEDGDSEALAQARADNGASLSGARNDVSVLEGRINYLQGRLSEGQHDNRTGAFAPALTGTARVSFETELASLSEELRTAHATVAAVSARVARGQQAEQTRVENDAVVTEFANNDPARKAALDKALLDREAGVMADWLLRRRYGAAG